jgi:hypothetical protein
MWARVPDESIGSVGRITLSAPAAHRTDHVGLGGIPAIGQPESALEQRIGSLGRTSVLLGSGSACPHKRPRVYRRTGDVSDARLQVVELLLREPAIRLAAKGARGTLDRPPRAANKGPISITEAATGALIQQRALAGRQLPAMRTPGGTFHEPNFLTSRRDGTARILAESLAPQDWHAGVHEVEAVSNPHRITVALLLSSPLLIGGAR